MGDHLGMPSTVALADVSHNDYLGTVIVDMGLSNLPGCFFALSPRETHPHRFAPGAEWKLPSFQGSNHVKELLEQGHHIQGQMKGILLNPPVVIGPRDHTTLLIG